MKNIHKKVFISGLQPPAGCYHSSSNLNPTDEAHWPPLIRFDSMMLIVRFVFVSKKPVMVRRGFQDHVLLLGNRVASREKTCWTRRTSIIEEDLL